LDFFVKSSSVQSKSKESSQRNSQPPTQNDGVRYIDYNFKILFYPKLFLILSLFFVCTVIRKRFGDLFMCMSCIKKIENNKNEAREN